MARFCLVFGWCLYFAVVFRGLFWVSAFPLVADNSNNVEEENEDVVRRSAAPERSTDDYPDYLLGVKYDEYPMIVPKKRSAMLIDRLMVALSKAIEEEEKQESRTHSTRSNYSMDLQRRGQGVVPGQQQKGRNVWRCYFNAVTCF